MFVLKRNLLLAASLALLAAAPSVQAQLAVIDVRAIVQMAQQLTTLQQQLQTAQQQFDSMSGGRGMERLLNAVPRNYLPPNWAELDNILRNASTAYNSISTKVSAAVDGNAVLTPQQLSTLAVDTRRLLEQSRRAAALLQVTSREGLANTSERFNSIQQLINAIPSATDQKAILDLQARIQAEQGMLQNEQTKLQMLYQNAQAEEWARRQREQEIAIAAHGRFDTRFRPTFP